MANKLNIKSPILDLSEIVKVNNASLEFVKSMKSHNSQFRRIAEEMNIASKIFINFNNTHSEQVKRIAAEMSLFSKNTKNLFDKLKIGNIFEEFEKVGLTPNLGKSKSSKYIRTFINLISKGYAIFWIPRSEIVDRIVFAKSEKERRTIVISNAELILTDCENAIKKIENKKLQNYIDHLLASIDSMKNKNFRASQSTSTICIDAMFNEIIDTSNISAYKVIPSSIKNADKLKVIDKIPAIYLYAALQAQLITYLFKKFDRLKPESVPQEYSRHASTHSVSHKQYKPFNAMLAIMIATSLLLTTNKLGPKWLSKLSGYPMSKK